MYNKKNKVKIFLQETIYFYFFILTPLIMYASKFLADFFLSLVALHVLLKLRVNWKKITEIKYFFILIFYFFINSFFNSVDLISQLKCLALIRFPLFIIYPFFINYNNFKKNITYRVFVTLLIFTAIFFADMIYQSIFLKNFIGFPADTSYFRISGFFNKELVAGSYLFFIFFIFLFYFSIFNKFSKLSVLILLTIYFCIFISGDRTPFLTINLFLFILAILNYKYILNIRVFIFLTLLIFLTSLFFVKFENYVPFQKYRGTYNEIINDVKNIKSSDNFVFSRWGYYDFSVKSYLIFRNNIFFGTGYKKYLLECKKDIYKYSFFKITNKKNSDGCDNHPHNFYLQILTEQGLVGLILFCLFLFNLTNLDQKNTKHNIKLILTTFVLTYFFPFKPSGSFYTNFNLILLCSVLSFTIFFNNMFKKNNIMRNY